MRSVSQVPLLMVALAFTAYGSPITTSPGSVLLLYTGFPAGSIQQYTRTGTAGPTLGLSVLGDIPESLTILNGQVYVGDGSGRVNLINSSTGAGTQVFSTSNVGLVGLGTYNGTLLAVNNTPNVINQYSATGAFLGSINLSSVPSGVNWSGLTSDNSTIYLGDYNSGRIYEYSSVGTLLGFFDTHLGAGLTAGSYDFSNSSMWVTDTNTGQAYDITTAGVALSAFGAGGRPFGVAVVPPSSVTPEPSCGSLLLVGLAVSVSLTKSRWRNRCSSGHC
jgi:hypothetical protein